MKNLIVFLVGFCVLGLLPTTPALAQAATDVKCDGCVHSGDIATNGVRRVDIQNFAVNTPKLNNFAVTSAKIKTAAVTESKLADGAVTLGKLDSGVADRLIKNTGGISAVFGSNFIQGRYEGPRFPVTHTNAFYGTTYIESEACSQWNDALSDMASPGGPFTSIEFGGAFDGYTCTDPEAADLIVKGLASGERTDTDCDGNTWSSGQCGGTTLNVNSTFCNCSATMVVRPCQNSVSWGTTDSTADSCGGGNSEFMFVNALR